MPHHIQVTLKSIAGLLVVLIASPLGTPNLVDAADENRISILHPDQPLPDIFVDARASAPEKFAAKEFRDALEKITGRRLEIRTDYWIKDAPSTPFIAIGQSRFTADIPIQDLATEQYVIDVTPHRIAIVGARDRQRGILYGVYELLEQLGVRWYRPEPWGEHVPKLETVSMPIGRRVRQQPDYAYRSVLAGGFTRQAEATLDQSDAAALWSLRHRMNGADPGSDPRHGGQVELHFDHIYYQLIPVEEYFDKHPEYFCFYKGQRRRTNPDSPGRPDNPTALQLCLSNLELQELFAQKIIARAKGRYDLKTVSFSMTPNDACPFCECDACRAMDDPKTPLSMSNRVCEFTNIVARKVAREVPGARLSLNAYSTWTDPPTIVKRIEPNVLIHIALINGWSDYTKNLDAAEPNWNSSTKAASEKWKQLGTSEIYAYEYWSGYGWPGPIPIARTIAGQIEKLPSIQRSRGLQRNTSVVGSARNRPVCVLTTDLESRSGCRAGTARLLSQLLWSGGKADEGLSRSLDERSRQTSARGLQWRSWHASVDFAQAHRRDKS